VPGKEWRCPLPASATLDDARVLLRVTVSATGAAEAVEILEDPGQGFGEVAQRCAMARTYDGARDTAGAPTATTKEILVRFVR
jgi:hypothetical protein